MNSLDLRMEGKTALITGAGRGIGKGIAIVFAEAGVDVAVTGLTLENAENVAKEIADMGRRGLAFSTDATNLGDTEQLSKDVIQEFGHLDILVNCVGDSIPGAVSDMPGSAIPTMTHANWQHILDINLTQAFMGCHVFGRHFLERRTGSVINISSFAGLRGRANISAYTAAKAGLIRFTESVALEWAPYGVRVNGIAPGYFPDPEQISLSQLRTREEQASRNIPLRRTGKPKEVGALALFLASNEASYITGQTVVIDGGMTLAG